jgi:hypothetical protein
MYKSRDICMYSPNTKMTSLLCCRTEDEYLCSVESCVFYLWVSPVNTDLLQ